MKIKKVYIKNFRSIKELSFTFPEKGILVLVGPNNAGKSNILRAINALLGDTWFSNDKLEIYDYYCRNKDNKIEIRIEFDNGRKVCFDMNNNFPRYLDPFGNIINKYNGNVKEDFPCTYLDASRNLSKEMEFRNWTLMGRISKSFSNTIDKEKEKLLKEKFNDVMAIFDQIENFVNFKKDFIKFFNEMQVNSSYTLKVDFKPFSPSNYFKTINILASDPNLSDKFDIELEEFGEGARNIVLLALLRSYAKNFRNDAEGIIAIEEPEIFMHPQARRHLYNIFWEIVKNSNMQIILTTHSSTFVRTEDFDTIGKVYKVYDENKKLNTKLKLVTKDDLVDFCIKTGVPKEKTGDNIFEFYRTTSNYKLNEGFFARFLILVEGETEELALPVYLKKAGVDCDLLGISIIAVNGKNQMPKYWRLFYKFDIPILVIFDNDNSEDKESSNKNIAECFHCSIEDILKDVNIYKIIEATDNPIEPTFRQKLVILEKNFETALRKDWLRRFGSDEKIDEYEKEAKDFIKPLKNQNKGQIARFIAEKIVENYSFIPEFVKEIKDIVLQVLDE
ncbi:ATP-dependent nuclease [Thermoanaerobacterium sp. DL9XJH110]|uniref:ATP-dependent nuclease n=1 Tax=Thermoanaerobacterium sp. DL9XJH110 TaxID=3386643 RepID=UPI003BB700CD